MKTTLLFGCLFVAAALTARDHVVLVADDALALYNRHVFCEINDCETWNTRPWHVSARALRRHISDDQTLRREIASQWEGAGAPDWMKTLLD